MEKKIKDLKKDAKQNFKKHIIFFIIVCAIATFIGAEFKGSLFIFDANDEGENIHSLTGVVTSVMENGLDETRVKIENYIQQSKDNETEVVGRSKGVFATSINAISSGSIFLIGFSVFKGITNSHTIIMIITILIAALIYFLFSFYIVNIYQVIARRIFLEGKTYKKIPFRRMVFLSKVRKWNNVSCVMFIKKLYQTLWDLTIIGGIIKNYSYLMVPYILAENPSVKANTAITLSRKMMDGHKWEAFKIDLTFIGWNILGVITSGLSNLFFTNPYTLATFAEYYIELRKIAKEKNIENADLLNDTYLYELAPTETINEEYKDAIEIIKQEDYIVEKKKGIKFAIFEFLGIHGYSDEEKKYEKQKLKEFVTDEYSPVIEKETYPFRLFTIKPKDTKHRIESLNYMRRYSLNSLILIFFIISFIGWIWEVVLYLINEGIFVNRGTMHGPWLPIYGGGSLLILLCLSKYRKNIPLQFILAVILCGFVEYFTAWQLEATHGGTKWWDYSGYFLNLHGRICAEGLLTFGFGGLAMVYFVAPALDNRIRKMNKTVLTIITVVLVSIFTVDVIYSHKNPNTGRGINDYEISYIENQNKNQNKNLINMEKLYVRS